MTNPLTALADIAADWQHCELTDSVVWAARRAMLDWFATTLPGCICPPATVLAHALGPSRGRGGALCYVDGQAGEPRYAALLNATASHTVEFDDIFKDGGYHPGSSTIAAALAVAQDRGERLEQLHRAIIGGYDVGCRISLAIQPSHYKYWHTTSTVGTIGAAVAAAMLLTDDAESLGHAIALATSFAGGHQQNLQGVGMAKAMHPGHAAEAGVLAAIAASNGVTGDLGSLHAPIGYAAATSNSTGNWEAALSGIGDWTPIERMTVKNHGCCGHIFPALDGLAAICRDNDVAVDDIATIHVDGYTATLEMCDRPEPASVREALFSVQYCLAVQLMHGKVRLDAFRDDVFRQGDIRSLMTRISVSEDAELAAAYPSRRMARVHVRMSDGREFSHFQQTRKGDPENPLTDDELIAKFVELASTTASLDTVEKLCDDILYGNALPGPVALDGKNDLHTGT